jgi:uncharacterized HAD superfamily protein
MYEQKLTIGVDIDGILCEERPYQQRPVAPPIKENIAAVNKLFAKGHIIILFTARGWNEYYMTEQWLSLNGVCYDQLICGKPIFNVGVDDRIEPNMEKLLERISDAKIELPS